MGVQSLSSVYPDGTMTIIVFLVKPPARGRPWPDPLWAIWRRCFDQPYSSASWLGLTQEKRVRFPRPRRHDRYRHGEIISSASRTAEQDREHFLRGRPDRRDAARGGPGHRAAQGR